MCELYSDDYDGASVWSEQRISRARKAHRCDACGATIAPGDSYWRRFCITRDHGACDEPCCDACWTIAEAFGEEHRFTPCPSSLLEFVEDCAGEHDRGRPADERWARAAAEMRGRNKLAAENVAPA